MIGEAQTWCLPGKLIINAATRHFQSMAMIAEDHVPLRLEPLSIYPNHARCPFAIMNIVRS